MAAEAAEAGAELVAAGPAAARSDARISRTCAPAATVAAAVAAYVDNLQLARDSSRRPGCAGYKPDSLCPFSATTLPNAGRYCLLPHRPSSHERLRRPQSPRPVGPHPRPTASCDHKPPRPVPPHPAQRCAGHPALTMRERCGPPCPGAPRPILPCAPAPPWSPPPAARCHGRTWPGRRGPAQSPGMPAAQHGMPVRAGNTQLRVCAWLEP